MISRQGFGARQSRPISTHSPEETLKLFRIYIKMDLRKVRWDGRDWIDLAQDRDRWRAYVNAVMNLRVP
jgi:hypothetical protein